VEDPEHGAGVSVNAMFKSVNWVAVPGYEFFFQGNLAPGEWLTRAEFEAVERQAIAKGIYTGVTFHRFPGATSDTNLRDFLERAGIGTDLALQFARSVFCARLPVIAAMLDPIIAFLNDKNREYAEGEADYNWSAWADNCSHKCAMHWPPPTSGRHCLCARQRFGKYSTSPYPRTNLSIWPN
jgi:hypothetical protein